MIYTCYLAIGGTPSSAYYFKAIRYPTDFLRIVLVKWYLVKHFSDTVFKWFIDHGYIVTALKAQRRVIIRNLT